MARLVASRLARLERVHGATRPRNDWPPAFVLVRPHDWPEADRDAFAAGDAEAVATVVERHTGHPADRAALLFVVVPSREPGP